MAEKPKGGKKVQGKCFKCEKKWHFKANCPKNNNRKKQKEIAMVVTKVMMVEPTTNSWWVGLAMTIYIARDWEFFVDFKEKAFEEHKVYMRNLQDEPMNFKESMSNNDAEHWLEAMSEELDLIKKNDVLEPIDLPSQRKAIWCK